MGAELDAQAPAEAIHQIGLVLACAAAYKH